MADDESWFSTTLKFSGMQSYLKDLTVYIHL